MKIANQITLFIILLFLTSCGKEFLDVKRESNQVVPSKIEDYQAILDNQRLLNVTSHQLSYLGADEYYMKTDLWRTLSGQDLYEKNAYIWADDIFEGNESLDWNWPYERIQYANMALEVKNIKPLPEEVDAWNEVKGGALFLRAFNFYQLAQLFCKPYDKGTANSEQGIPLRLDYDVSVKVERGTLAETYDQIIKDLKEAEALLPVQVLSKFRPSLLAVYALLARVYLNMEDYEQAEQYSSLALKINSRLLDYNNLVYGGMFKFSNFSYGINNPEVIYYSHSASSRTVSYNYLRVDTLLLELYREGDLRFKAYFETDKKDGRVFFNGSYSGSNLLFTGLSTAELLLIKAECHVRLGRVTEAIDILNLLLQHRLDKNVLKPIIAGNKEEVLKFILEEKRKELYLRGTRWEDLRRLNKNPETEMTLTREIDGQKYELKPNAPRWVWPIPDNEIKLNGLIQNVR